MSTEWNCFARKAHVWEHQLSNLPKLPKNSPPSLQRGEDEELWEYYVRVYCKVEAVRARQYPHLRALGFFRAASACSVEVSSLRI